MAIRKAFGLFDQHEDHRRCSSSQGKIARFGGTREFSWRQEFGVGDAVLMKSRRKCKPGKNGDLQHYWVGVISKIKHQGEEPMFTLDWAISAEELKQETEWKEVPWSLDPKHERCLHLNTSKNDVWQSGGVIVGRALLLLPPTRNVRLATEGLPPWVFWARYNLSIGTADTVAPMSYRGPTRVWSLLDKDYEKPLLIAITSIRASNQPPSGLTPQWEQEQDVPGLLEGERQSPSRKRKAQEVSAQPRSYAQQLLHKAGPMISRLLAGNKLGTATRREYTFLVQQLLELPFTELLAVMTEPACVPAIQAVTKWPVNAAHHTADGPLWESIGSLRKHWKECHRRKNGLSPTRQREESSNLAVKEQPASGEGEQSNTSLDVPIAAMAAVREQQAAHEQPSSAGTQVPSREDAPAKRAKVEEEKPGLEVVAAQATQTLAVLGGEGDASVKSGGNICTTHLAQLMPAREAERVLGLYPGMHQSVAEWLARHPGLLEDGGLVKVLVDELIDVEVLENMTKEEFVEVGLKFGQRKKIMMALEKDKSCGRSQNQAPKLPPESG
eukprot:TRINITY_DN10151_c0_g1_i1.p1 TRINITY_DN10151_c0_g1~~TRINITY_DN10151_c0_g1_i1.p1  ORF type:complete len:555 (-),score=137.18 TRINITY_DN10151_c0_g1_i1:58-1722(-)